MIYLEIIKSSDSLALGVYEFEFDQISIGRSKKNDLIFLDPELPLKYLNLKIIQGQLIVQSLDLTLFYFINSKKISGALKLMENDLISFGENQIRVLKSSITNKIVDFTPAYDDFNKSVPELKFILDFIEEIVEKLEKDSNV